MNMFLVHALQISVIPGYISLFMYPNLRSFLLSCPRITQHLWILTLTLVWCIHFYCYWPIHYIIHECSTCTNGGMINYWMILFLCNLIVPQNDEKTVYGYYVIDTVIMCT
ncbi:hypothetical protein BDB01DRAFT_803492 [Pilobolus umbonatus]|nr:hypothetical protein BDB01DRAFT_803492 [Pilobolus umbonatus]